MATDPSILVIDDDADVSEFILSAAENLGIPCVVTHDAPVFFAALNPEVSLVMIDLMMPDTDGIEVLRRLGRECCQANVVLMSGLGKQVLQTAEQLALSLGLSVIGHLRKPFRLKELEAVFTSSSKTVAKSATRTRQIVLQDNELATAIEHDQLTLHYQPQIHIVTRKAIGVEALVRWQHPLHGLIYPDAFIPRAEQLGLIEKLTWKVIRRGLTEMRLFADRSGFLPSISFNIPVQSLHDLTFPDKLIAVIEERGVLPQDVILEVTETGLLRELSTTLDVLARLRMKQVRLSVDDFGTGYSMMQQLKKIPATELKIDKSFVQSLPGSSSDRIMAVKTIELGHELGMTVVAEGVETEAQLDFLQSNLCNIAQGYLFSRPVPAEDLAAWLTQPPR